MLFSIDESKCSSDGICAAECPVGVIEFSAGMKHPRPSADAEEYCISCGHCVAVCPRGAFVHRDGGPASCEPLDRKTSIPPADALRFLRSRRSVRSYRPEPLDTGTLERILDTARYAPTGHNSQTVKWIVVIDPSILRGVTAAVADWLRYMVKEHGDIARGAMMDRVLERYDAGEEVICRGAPHLLIAWGEKEDHFAQSSCVIALAHAELAAHALGLGACWAGYVNAAANFWPAAREALGLPENAVTYGALMLGRAKYRFARVPARNEAAVSWL